MRTKITSMKRAFILFWHAYSHEGTRASMGKDTSTRMNFFSRLSCMKMKEADGCSAPMSAEERHNLYTSMADEAFDEEEGK